MARCSVPQVSIGLPVRNGEDFVAESIASVLSQSFENLELILQDNASTDRTAEICRDYARSDPRVRYFRNPRNLGAVPNFNQARSHARGRFFKWQAHDDRLLPGYLDTTVRALRERPDAVLCNTVVRYVDARGVAIGRYDSGLDRADAESPSARFAAMVLPSHSCVDCFGLIRLDALRASPLASFHGTDRALLAELALRGRFVQLKDVQVEMREHPRRYTRRAGIASERSSWHDTALRGRITFPTWRLYAEYAAMVRRATLPASERRRCYGVLLRWWLHNWNALRAGIDLVAVVAPAAPGAAEQLKARLFGAAPGHLSAERSA